MKYQGTFAGANDTTAKIQATTALFNGYLDLGTWYRATPYIGGGAGVAYARTTDYVSGGAPPFTGDNRQDAMEFRLGRHGRHRLRDLAQHHDRCRLPLSQSSATSRPAATPSAP